MRSYLILPPLRYHEREVFVQLLVSLGQLQTLRVLLVEGADVEGVRGVDFPSGRDERRGVLLLIDLSPVNSSEEGVSLELLSSLTRTTKSLINVTLRSEKEGYIVISVELCSPAAVTPADF